MGLTHVFKLIFLEQTGVIRQSCAVSEAPRSVMWFIGGGPAIVPQDQTRSQAPGIWPGRRGSGVSGPGQWL